MCNIRGLNTTQVVCAASIELGLNEMMCSTGVRGWIYGIVNMKITAN